MRISTAAIADEHRRRRLGRRRCPRLRLPPLSRHRLPHVHVVHLEPGGVAGDAVHDRVRVHAAAELRVPVVLPELRAQDGRRPAVTQLEKLQQHPPEQLVRLLEQAERPVLTQQLPLAAWPVAALAPEVLEVGLPYVAGPDPLGAGRLGERAREVGLAGPGRPAEHDVVAALGESAGRELHPRRRARPFTPPRSTWTPATSRPART